MEFEDDEIEDTNEKIKGLEIGAVYIDEAEVVEPKNNPLVTIINESGLEKTKAHVILDKFHNAFEFASEWESRAKHIIVTDENQEYEMKQARDGRLLLKKKRCEIEATRKELKEQALREGKAIDGIANVLKALIIPIEEYLEKQEKFVENKRAAEEEARRLEAERIAEEERFENERQEKLVRGRRELCLPYKSFWKNENPDFRNMTEENFEKALESLKAKKKSYDDEQEKIRVENERLKKEAEEKEAKLKAEREEAERVLAEERAKAEAAKKALEDKARKEKEAAEKKLADEKAKAEAKAKKEREDAERKLAKEKAKAEALAEQLKNLIECPKCGHKFERNSHAKEI